MVGKKPGRKSKEKKDDASSPRSTSPTASGEEGDGAWECTLCTYRNRFEAFKCEMCDTRKGTSTRKPRLDSSVVERQKTVQNFVVQQQEKAVTSFKRSRVHHGGVSGGSPSTARMSPESSSSKSSHRPCSSQKTRAMIAIPDQFIYRSSPKKVTVVVKGVTATITEFRRKPITAERVASSRNLTNVFTTKPRRGGRPAAKTSLPTHQPTTPMEH